MKAGAVHRFLKFLIADGGVTAVEFAMLSPVFFATSLLMLELGMYELYAASLSYATQRAARQILVGNVANGGTVSLPTFINNYICPTLPPPMTCGRIVVNSQVMTTESSPQNQSSWWTMMNGSHTWLAPAPMNNTQTNFCIGSGGSTVGLAIYYAMPFWSIPFMTTPSTTYNGSPVIWIVSTAAFKNEPFSTSYAGC